MIQLRCNEIFAACVACEYECKGSQFLNSSECVFSVLDMETLHGLFKRFYVNAESNLGPHSALTTTIVMEIGFFPDNVFHGRRT